MKILFLSFYYKPDLSAGSFRNTTLSEELSNSLDKNDNIHVITSMPNRYATYNQVSEKTEINGNILISRIQLPKHRNGYFDQVMSFMKYFISVMKITRHEKYDLVYASSSRLFTAFLARIISNKQKIPLYLDIRDIFVDNLHDIFNKSFAHRILFHFIKKIENYTFSKANHINLISAGFECYFKEYPKPNYSFYPNGIDAEFMEMPTSKNLPDGKYIVTYAGNIGEGQGLDKIIPILARKLESEYIFRIIGDGGMKEKLKKSLREYDVHNVELYDPMARQEIIKFYSESHFLFLHLNNYEAFEKVLPSKIFEYAATDKPIIAGVSGFAESFIRRNICNSIIFKPGNIDDLLDKLSQYKFSYVARNEFKEEYNRNQINKIISHNILHYAS